MMSGLGFYQDVISRLQSFPPVLVSSLSTMKFVLKSTKERLVVGYEKDTNAWDLLWLVAFGSIPFLGIGMLILTTFAVLCALSIRHQFPRKLIVFDKNNKLLIIKSKFLLWHLTTQYAFNEIVEAVLYTRNIYAGSMSVGPMDYVRLTLRRQDGKILQEDILCGGVADHGVVHQINRFLKY